MTHVQEYVYARSRERHYMQRGDYDAAELWRLIAHIEREHVYGV